MSVLISGLNLPNDKPVTLFITSNGNVYLEGVLLSGKAVPVPPHGDLIDRDEQIERAWRLNLSTRELIEEMLKSAHTIIQAEEKT